MDKAEEIFRRRGTEHCREIGQTKNFQDKGRSSTILLRTERDVVGRCTGSEEQSETIREHGTRIGWRGEREVSSMRNKPRMRYRSRQKRREYLIGKNEEEANDSDC